MHVWSNPEALASTESHPPAFCEHCLFLPKATQANSSRGAQTGWSADARWGQACGHSVLFPVLIPNHAFSLALFYPSNLLLFSPLSLLTSAVPLELWQSSIPNKDFQKLEVAYGSHRRDTNKSCWSKCVMNDSLHRC